MRIKRSVIICMSVLILSCNDPRQDEAKNNNQPAHLSLNYKPGFGEFMTYIQIHHAKLWFAGKYENWKLADFELNEIKEAADAIQTYQKDRVESQALPIIYPALDAIAADIRQQDQKSFIQSYINLTNTCNTCHQGVKFGFNAVKIPDTPPFSNQDFSVQRQPK
jgi:hypothetical protein